MFWLRAAALPHMRPGKSIIYVSSIQAYQPSPTLLPYSSTKGTIPFIKGLAQEVVSQYGLWANFCGARPRVDPEHPGLDARQEGLPVRRHSPMGRPAQPAELASAFVFLALQ